MLLITTKVPMDFRGSLSLKVGENEVPKSKVYPDAARHIAHLAKHGLLTVVDMATGEEVGEYAALKEVVPEEVLAEPIPEPCLPCLELNEGGPIRIPCKACYVKAGYDEASYLRFIGKEEILPPPMDEEEKAAAEENAEAVAAQQEEPALDEEPGGEPAADGAADPVAPTADETPDAKKGRRNRR